MTREEGEISARHYRTGEAITVQWKKGLITSVAAADGVTPDTWIAPGLVDLQINGFAGIDFQQDALQTEDLITATRALRAAGCTKFLLTLITHEWERLIGRLKHLRALREASAELRSAIIGWHVEGPFLSREPGFHGAHDASLMISPTPGHITQLQMAVGGDRLLLTLSPEVEGAVSAIEFAVSRGIKISLGHTNASAEVLRRAVNAGATGFTHLGNGCPRDLDRHDNILWRIFETEGLTVSLVPDRIHVSPPLFRLMHRVLKPDAVYYTTDAMSAAGGSPGTYKLGGLELQVGPDQIVRQPGSKLFAGSALKPVDGVFRAANMLGSSWQEAWERFSEVPARFMGAPSGLAMGLLADFCVLAFSAPNEIRSLDVVGP